jgi:cob(I)alamin adenosyltransferase
MALEEFNTKDSLILVFTGEGKGKTSAAIGLLVRALGAGWKVAFIQFIKAWTVNEDNFLSSISPIYKDNLLCYKGGKGFFKASDMTANEVTLIEHKTAALKAYQLAEKVTRSGKYNLVICDEINNAVNDGLLTVSQLQSLITNKSANTNLCLTGRNFPKQLIDLVDIATEMKKVKHHYDDKFLANFGIDY